jgi:hypothetical protein
MLVGMSIQVLALVGLVIGAALYALLLRRRVAERVEQLTMSRALTASNEIALARVRDAPRVRAAAVAATAAVEVVDEAPGIGVLVRDRRSGKDRRAENQAGRGRGRRAGGDRRRRWRR